MNEPAIYWPLLIESNPGESVANGRPQERDGLRVVYVYVDRVTRCVGSVGAGA